MNTKDFSFCPTCQNPLRKQFENEFLRLVCDKCADVIYPGPKVGVAVIIEAFNKVVLVRRKYEPYQGKWCFPSGYMEIGETAEEAAIREVKEETGFDIKLTRLFGVYTDLEEPRGETLVVVYGGSNPEERYGLGRAGDDASGVGFYGWKHLGPGGEMSNELASALTQEIATDYLARRR